MGRKRFIALVEERSGELGWAWLRERRAVESDRSVKLDRHATEKILIARCARQKREKGKKEQRDNQSPSP